MKTVTIKELEKRVKCGIRYLNNVKPGWHKKINLTALNLSHPRVCICGQLFESYFSVIYATDTGDGQATKRKKIAMTEIDSRKRGFVLDPEDYSSNILSGRFYSYDTLTRIWFLEISKIREN